MKHPHAITEQVALSLQDLGTQSICVGLSGGIDSVVLLHILKHLEPKVNLNAIHINHNISPNANKWSLFCQNLCANLDIPLHVENISLNRSGGESLENIARIARHKILLQSSAEAIALAHHQNDQVETILSQLFRGSDLHNIAAMHSISQKQGKILWRPLLNISKAQIEEYAALYKLEYIHDESNLDITFLRNFIRHDVMPLLGNWDENIVAKLLNFNGQLQRMLSITDEVGIQDLASCCRDKQNIDIESFRQLSSNRQINLLGQFIKTNSLTLPSNKQLSEFVKQATTSNWDRKPRLKLGDKTLLIKYKNSISLDIP